MNDELFNLCKEVYKRFPEWRESNTHRWFYDIDGEIKLLNTIKIGAEPKYHSLAQVAPLYTSDYLLEQLPLNVGDNYLGAEFRSGAISYYYESLYDFEKLYRETSDTPLKALLELVIALDEAGVKL